MSFQFPVRIYYEDTDAGGVVYHANYLNFYERCRTEYLRNLGFDQEQLLKDNIAFVVRRCEIDYLLPARFNDLLSVTVTVTGNRRTNVTFEQQIFSQTGKLLSTAVVVVVCVAIDQMKPTAIPQHILKEFMSDC